MFPAMHFFLQQITTDFVKVGEGVESSSLFQNGKKQTMNEKTLYFFLSNTYLRCLCLNHKTVQYHSGIIKESVILIFGSTVVDHLNSNTVASGEDIIIIFVLTFVKNQMIILWHYVCLQVHFTPHHTF